MTKEIDNSEDIIDSRDVIARIDGLESTIEAERDDAGEAYDAMAPAPETPRDVHVQRHLEEHCNDEMVELAKLKALADDAEGYSDWEHGAQLIRDSHFEDYAQELAEDVGLIKSDVAWPYTCIDWEKAARELRMDYTCVSFDGVDYWIRS